MLCVLSLNYTLEIQIILRLTLVVIFVRIIILNNLLSLHLPQKIF